jgi:diamine N-acetyltransferase
MNGIINKRIRIRIAERADAALIADLSRKTFYDAIGPFNTRENMDKFMSVQFNREKLMAEVGRPDHIFILAYHNDIISGYACLREAEIPDELKNFRTIEIGRIYVTQETIGSGVGSALMQHCIDIAKEKNKEVIWLGVWEHNPKAYQFYLNWGFERFSEHIFMLGDDPQTDWLMKKQI